MSHADIDSAIRDQIAEDVFQIKGSDPDTFDAFAVDRLSSALLAVLDVHVPEPEGGPFAHSLCRECREGGPGYEVEPVQYPCPTVLAIAEKPRIETA